MNSKRLFAVGAFVLAAFGHARAEAPDLTSPGTRDLAITIGETERTYRLHVPANFQRDKAAPLVIALH